MIVRNFSTPPPPRALRLAQIRIRERRPRLQCAHERRLFFVKSIMIQCPPGPYSRTFPVGIKRPRSQDTAAPCQLAPSALGRSDRCSVQPITLASIPRALWLWSLHPRFTALWPASCGHSDFDLALELARFPTLTIWTVWKVKPLPGSEL